ncbi:MAG: O-antigen ligase family protein [Luteolibacter sp.]
MPVISSIFLVLALVMAVVIGPQTRDWTWGPAMLSLGISVLAACSVFWKRDKTPGDFGLIAFATLVAGWFSWRAWISPVAELGQADLLLVCGAVGGFISIRAIAGNAAAGRILIWGIALLLLANVSVAGIQMTGTSFSPVFRGQPDSKMVSGFFAHYNEAANYFIVSSMLVGAAGLFGRHHAATRVLWILIALAGLAAVWFTRSRGGIFGAAIAFGVFAVVTLVVAKKRNARWFAPALIALPLVGFAIGAYLFLGWQGAQQVRRAGADITEMFDNNSRLYLLGMALSCVNLHPIIGGGSRSFSWECFRFAAGKTQGDIITHKPEQVHNELVQAATDYGLIGGGLLLGLLGSLAVLAILRIFFEKNDRGPRDSYDAWRLGALAGLAGMLVQSCFSFVFHLMPGILFLGVCLGQMSLTSAPPGISPQKIGSRVLLSLAACACCLLLIPLGWKGTWVTKSLWPTYFSKQPLTSFEAKIDALTEAILLWPQSGFYQDRATNYQALALTTGDKANQEATTAALSDYQHAALLHPYDPAIAINHANLLSQLHRDSEAEAAYALGLRLQGGMEPSFRGHLSLANHYMRKGLRLFRPEEPAPALVPLELAAQQIETAVKEMHWLVRDMLEPRLAIHESLGTAREASGDSDGALESYNFATTLQNGTRAHYRAGVLYGKLAAGAWATRKPSEALGYFIKARERIAAAKELPQGVAPSQRVEYLAYLDQTIAFLKGAKIVPTPPK